jgi:hypothetical protein
MSLWDKLKQATQSHGRGSYFRYKRQHDHDRERAEHLDEFEKKAAAQKDADVEREHGYEERYARERKRKTDSE